MADPHNIISFFAIFSDYAKQVSLCFNFISSCLEIQRRDGLRECVFHSLMVISLLFFSLVFSSKAVANAWRHEANFFDNYTSFAYWNSSTDMGDKMLFNILGRM